MYTRFDWVFVVHFCIHFLSRFTSQKLHQFLRVFTVR
ncbi:Uncharacterised protein [Vibrio cholerae]|nr:Uncharacterised protein [Vibrio cholerae]CSI56765.1 Uncharacterised protein [Vibrio cholerae]